MWYRRDRFSPAIHVRLRVRPRPGNPGCPYRLAALEGTEEAVAFSSGMAALTAAVLAAKTEIGGRHVIAVRPLYGGDRSPSRLRDARCRRVLLHRI